MKISIVIFILGITFSCTQQKNQKETAPTSDTVIDIPATAYRTDKAEGNANLNPAFATVPVFRTYSKKVFTNDVQESAIVTSLDSLFVHYLKQSYFSIVSDRKSWHLNENKQLRIITVERENETVKEISIYLFDDGKLIAAYSDVDMDGQDTQRNRERIAIKNCPDCGVRFDLTAGQPAVTSLRESRVNELAGYLTQDYNEVLGWIAQAPILMTEGNNTIFERGSPNNARYTVNTELYNKSIKHHNQ